MKYIHKDGTKACTWCSPGTNPVPRLKKEPPVLPDEPIPDPSEYIMEIGEEAYEDEIIGLYGTSESET
jgi:hypothetical protein